MRHLLTSLALLATFAVAGQSNPILPSYNPDVNGDGYIAIVDVLEVLLNYGEAFEAAAVWCTDSSAVTVQVEPDGAPFAWADCANACRQLNGDWTLPEDDEASWVLEQSDAGRVFVSSRQVGSSDTYDFVWYDPAGGGWTEYGDAGYSWDFTENPVDCFCVSRLQPSVEYDLCQTTYGNPDGVFEACVNEKLQSGWNLLGGTSIGGNSPALVQGFWRYSD